MPTELHRMLGDLVAVNHRLTRVAATAAGGTESPALWRTLSVLETTGPIRLGELAELSRVAQPTATKIVAGLVERGWVERQADPTDARATQIAATDAGLAAKQQWRNKLAEALVPLFDDLAPEEIRILEQAVTIVRNRVDLSERGVRNTSGTTDRTTQGAQ
ncbi:MarR family winged helix-turn-helix transcriptional regulator [Glaciibacter sp. 2TAF33]|uniref:MarR family winged helix-turn-helix transcriptional regulator n=1 Tax=Glaciibacter sp. 2TAF33 TaxID=3233015 RepID=UPI003F92D82B